MIESLNPDSTPHKTNPKRQKRTFLDCANVQTTVEACKGKLLWCCHFHWHSLNSFYSQFLLQTKNNTGLFKWILIYKMFYFTWDWSRDQKQKFINIQTEVEFAHADSSTKWTVQISPKYKPVKTRKTIQWHLQCKGKTYNMQFPK